MRQIVNKVKLIFATKIGYFASIWSVKKKMLWPSYYYSVQYGGQFRSGIILFSIIGQMLGSSRRGNGEQEEGT